MLEKIAEMIREYRGNNELVVTEETTFESLKLDSLDVVELAMSMEEEFSVTIKVSADIKSVGDLMAVIKAGQE